MRQHKFKKSREPVFFFNLRREFNGKKYQFGGEYPYDKPFVNRIKRVMNSNGLDVYFQFKRQENSFIIWTRKK